MNMFSKEEILTQLAAGRSLEAIAQECADALNEAKAQYEKEKAAKAKVEEARARALQERKEKEQRINSMFDDLMDYLADFHSSFFTGSEISTMKKSFNASEFVNLLDSAVAELESIPAVAAQLKKHPSYASVKLTGEDAKKAEDSIQKFLKENGLF
jgi:hypothetical protein